MNIYYYIFFKIYRFVRKMAHKGDIEWNVMFGITVLVGLNFVVLFSNFLPMSMENFKKDYKVWFITVVILIFLANYFLFVHNKRYLRILDRFKDESNKQRRIGAVCVILYVILSVSALFLPRF